MAIYTMLANCYISPDVYTRYSLRVANTTRVTTMKIERENAKSPAANAGNATFSFDDEGRGRNLRAVSYLLKTSNKRATNKPQEVNDEDQNTVYWKGYN